MPRAEDVRRELDALSRSPFRYVLADFLACAPTTEAIAKIAQRSPDRWAQALAIIAKLSGYNERVEVEGLARVTTMSDAELEQRIQEFAGRLVQAQVLPRSESVIEQSGTVDSEEGHVYAKDMPGQPGQ